MAEDSTKTLSNVIRIDDDRIQDHLKHVLRDYQKDLPSAVVSTAETNCTGVAA